MLYALEQPVSDKRTIELHQIARRLLGLNLVDEAWQVLLRVDIAGKPLENLVVVERYD